MRRCAAWASALALAAAAWGADVVVGGKAYVPPRLAAPGADDQLELGWDNGTGRWSIVWYTGKSTWVGNQFDLSTLSCYRVVDKVKFYTRDDWPNDVWDGFRVAIYDFSTLPGAVLWPASGGGYFFKPSGVHGHLWVEIPIRWTSPSKKFLAAVNQCYNDPDCDPFEVDNNRVFRKHSWQYDCWQWDPLVGFQDYRNLMLRVVVESTFGVTPTSVGRVKALYY
jgi:hypothetical protein